MILLVYLIWGGMNNDFYIMISNESPDLIAVAFQELVTLNAMNVVGNNNQI